MKQLLLFSVLCLLLPGQLAAQLYCGAPDFMAAQVYKSVYYDYVTDLSSKVFSGEVEVYNDPRLSSLLSITDRGTFLAETYEVEDIDPYTGDFVLLEVRDTLRGQNWQGIHFDLNYIYIKVNEIKSLYIPNKEKSREGTVQVYHSELTAGSVTGTGIRGSFVETSDGWHIEGQYFSINYSPVFSGIEFPPQPMCWIKREDLKSFLSAEDWLFLQELWGFALMEKLKRPFNSSDF